NILVRTSLPVYAFFFQADDGIRDRNVTGVQTCALPISWSGTKPQDPAKYLQGAILPGGQKGIEDDDPAAGIRDFLSGIVKKVTGKFDGDWAKATAEGVKGFYTKAVDKAIELGNTISGALPGGMGNA